MKRLALPPTGTLRELFEYDPDRGVLIWRIHRHLIGKDAGRGSPRGYWRVKIDGRDYQAHRLIWKWMTGDEPHEIDHWNRAPADNRWSNLRIAEHGANAANCRARRNNKSGLKGAYPTEQGRWMATIRVAGKVRYLGRYDTPEEAHAAYARAARDSFGEFARP